MKHKGKKIYLEVKDCGFLEKGRGLTFRRREKAPALLFEFKRKFGNMLTSYFVFFDFLVLWCDKNLNVLEIRKIKPWDFSFDSKTNYRKVVEIPINRRYRKEIKLLVGD